MRKLFSFVAAVLVALVANAAVINITNETPDALRLALNGASDGDEIVMAAGTYVESNDNYIKFDGKAVTVKAAEGAEVIIQPKVPITVSNGGHAKFENVKIDASHLTDLADWYEHLLYVTDENPNGCTFRGCELYGFNLNKSMFYCNSTNKLATAKFENCYFHDIMKSILFVENPDGKPMVSVKNCTFENIIAPAVESYYAGVIDVRAAEATLQVDHCTFYNVIPMNTDFSCVSKITLAKGTVSNCIFMLPTAQDGIRAMRGVTATNCITFNYLKDEGTGIHSSVTQNNCVQVDPAFVDPDNGNYTLSATSPALTMNDGQPIGDPRWVPAAAPALENGFYLVGSLNEWTPAAEYHLVGNPDNDAEYMVDVTLAENVEFKVVNVLNDEITAWFPGGDNYVVDANHAGEKTVYFRPDYQGGEDWFGACIYIAPNAEPQPVEMTTIYDWAGEIGTTVLGASGVEVSTVKIHTNTDEIPAIKFGNSYNYGDGKWVAIKPAEGGFQAGDVLSLAAVFNNADDTKYAQVDLRAANGDTRIWMSDSASTINGRTQAGEPIVQTYTLEADQDSLFLGRYGNTGMFVTLLKVERAAGVTPEHTYTVAGGSDVLFGTTWDPTNTANDMAKQEDGTYKWEKSELTLAAGNVEFKVCEDHAWTVAYPAQNYQLVIPEAGVYTITITYNPEGNVVAGDAVKTGDAVVDPVVSIAGSMNSWNASANVMTLAEDKQTATLALNLEAQTYEFKVVLNGGEWRSNAQEFTRENASAADMTGNLDNMHLVADVAGEYLFTWTFATNTLVITFPVGEGIDNTAVEVKAIKRIVNGQLFIEMNGVIYNAQGTIVR